MPACRFLIALALTVVAVDADVRGQAGQVPLVLLTGAGDYPGETYTTGPVDGAEVVYFAGEVAAIDVRVANWGGSSTRVPTRARLDVSVRRVSTGVREPVLLTTLEGVWLDGMAGSEPVDGASEIALAPGDALRWRVLLDSGLPEGMYQVEAAAELRGVPLRPAGGGLVIEVRPRAAAVPAELARRRAEWLAAHGHGREAWDATDELARVYPDGVAVHLIRSRLAEASGDAARARQELETAAEFMRHDRDVLFRQFARPGQIEDLVESLAP